jgi:hypothetical protein
MNYMPEVLKMLNLEIWEKFNLKPLLNSPYHFDEDYILVNKDEINVDDALIMSILIGECEIEKLPWKPKLGEVYFLVRETGLVEEQKWGNHIIDFYAYGLGNCFRTKKEITPEIKQRILQEMKGKYEND